MFIFRGLLLIERVILFINPVADDGMNGQMGAFIPDFS
jgi:hypothetical protein